MALNHDDVGPRQTDNRTKLLAEAGIDCPCAQWVHGGPATAPGCGRCGGTGKVEPVRTNGGQRCDVSEGPCSCGAWHAKPAKVPHISDAASPKTQHELSMCVEAMADELGAIGGLAHHEALVWLGRCGLTQGDSHRALDIGMTNGLLEKRDGLWCAAARPGVRVEFRVEGNAEEVTQAIERQMAELRPVAERIMTLAAVQAYAEEQWRNNNPAGVVVVDRGTDWEGSTVGVPVLVLWLRLGGHESAQRVPLEPSPRQVREACDRAWVVVSDAVARGWRP